jgi:hypothetical protein
VHRDGDWRLVCVVSALLPLDFPPLVAMAEDATRGVLVVWTSGAIHPALWEQHRLTDAHALLLADLSRPASRDAWARWLAERVGLVCGATAPLWRREQTDDLVWVWVLDAWDDENVFRDSAFPGISALTDPSEALRAAVLVVGAA